MTPRQVADAIAASVRASLQIAMEHGQTIEEALECGVDVAIGNNAAAVVAVQEVE